MPSPSPSSSDCLPSPAVARKEAGWSPRGIFGSWRLANGLARFAREKTQVHHEGQEEEVVYAPTYRWSPLICGIVVPFSILLEIGGIVESWYIRQERDPESGALRTVSYRNNPVLLDIGLGLSLFSAVVANAALCMRFLERRTKVSTIVAIAALTTHDVINLAAIISFGVIFTYNSVVGEFGEAYWTTVSSTVVSTLTNLLLIYDYQSVRSLRRAGSGITPKQRRLVIIVMVLLSYIALGALVDCFLMGLKYEEALYFVICSITSVGFGDIVPKTWYAKTWGFIYITGGIVTVGLGIAMARETILESFENSFRRRRAVLARRHRQHSLRRRVSSFGASLRRAATGAVQLQPDGGGSGKPGEEEEEESWKALRRKMERQERQEYAAKIGTAFGLFFMFWLFGAAVFMATEGWSYFNSLYFAFTYFSTVGYGDFSPKTAGGRAFFLVWSLLGISTMTILVTVLGEAWTARYRQALHSKSVSHALKRLLHPREGDVGDGDDEQVPQYPTGREEERDPRSCSLVDEDARAREEAEERRLPEKLLKVAQDFHAQLEYFAEHGTSAGTAQDLGSLLRRDPRVRHLPKEVLDDALEDDATRRMLWVRSYERSLDALIVIAQRAAEAQKRRDAEEAKVADEAELVEAEREEEAEEAEEQGQAAPPPQWAREGGARWLDPLGWGRSRLETN